MLSPLGEMVRTHDPDRFLATLFAPVERRETLFALYAFNHELARAREATSGATLGLIRLQWWREAVEGGVRRHPVADALKAEMAMGALDRAALLALIAGREPEMAPEIATLADWRGYLAGSAGLLAGTAADALGAGDAACAMVRDLGAAYGAAGVLRSIAVHARQNRCLLPADVLAAEGLSPEAVVAAPASPALAPVRRALAAEALAWLRAAPRPRLGRHAVAAALPAVLAARDLRRDAADRPRGLGDRLAVVRAGLAGRVPRLG